jgi:hypothetical protein
MSQLGLTDVEEVIHSLETDTEFGSGRNPRSLRRDVHFRKQHSIVKGQSTVYRIEDIDLVAQTIGLALPLPSMNEAKNPKPELTPEQEQRVLAYYAEDKSLYDSVEPGAGLSYTYMPPPPAPVLEPVPDSITATQIRLWLVRNGISMEQVSSAIASIEDPQSRAEAEVLWEYAPYVERTNPLVGMISTGFGMDEAAIDNAFREASTL